MVRKFRRFTRGRSFFWSSFLVIVLVFFGVNLGALWQSFFLEYSHIVPKYGGTYTESTTGEIRFLNPLSPNPTHLDEDIHQLVFDGLLTYNPFTGNIENNLGLLQKSDHGRVYEVVLQDDLRFSDGMALDISDVLFTYNSVIKNDFFGNENLRQAFEYVEISVSDGNTVRFDLPEQNVFFPHLLTLPILPKAYFDKVLIEEILDPDFPYNKKPIGSGPFRIKNIIPEDQGFYKVFLEANPHYHKGRPYLDQMVLYGYQRGFKPDMKKQNLRGVSRLGALKEVPDYYDYEYDLPKFVGVFFNLDKKISGTQYFRQALGLAFPSFDNILEKNTRWTSKRQPFFAEDLSLDVSEQDFVKARQLLRNADFRYSEKEALRTFENKPVELKLITALQPAIFSQFANQIKKVWEDELDIFVQVELLEPEAFQQALQKRDYDMVLFGQNFSRNVDMLSVWHSSQSGKLNLSNLTREDVDFLIEEIRFSGAKSDYQALQEKLNVLVPAIVFATPKYYLYTAKDLKKNTKLGKIRNFADRFSDIESWHLYTQLDWKFSRDKWKIWEFVKWLFD